MKIVHINSVLHGSTGKLMQHLGRLAVRQGHRVTLCVPKGRHNTARETGCDLLLFGSRLSEDSHILLARLTGRSGCFSYFATRSLLRRLDALQPDVVHLHNLHNSYVNLPLLFSWLKRQDIPMVWTLHDGWAFTGHCPYFSEPACRKWITGCHHCPRLKEYPISYVDATNSQWRRKRAWFTGVPRLHLVSPSCWLADQVRLSFLQDYPLSILPNGIDLDVFQPTSSDFRRKHHLEGKFLVLGVAAQWERRKGLDVLCRLASEFQVVLVGELLGQSVPEGVLTIPRTDSPQELAAIYSAADVFVNPTREDNFPTVNLEALACGTPVVTFPTGGSPEALDERSGCVVQTEAALGKALTIIRDTRPFSAENCRARAEAFDKSRRLQAYLTLYEALYDTTATKDL